MSKPKVAVTPLELYLGESDTQHLLQLLSSLLHFGVNISAHCLWHPGLMVELGPPLLFWVSSHICHQLQIPGLRLQPVLDELLWIIAEAQHEISFGLQLVNVLNGFMNLHLKGSDFLLVGCRRQEAVHLALKWVVHFHVDVVACSLLLIGGIHANDVIDNNGVRVLQQARQFHGNLREPHAWTAEDLDRI